MNEIFKIEKGVPIPPRKQKYPWHKMEVGDSFVIPGKGQNFGSATCSQANRRMNPKKFQAFHDPNGIRIFRIE